MQSSENNAGNSFGYVAKCTSALCTGLYNLGSYVFRDNQPVQAHTSGGATLAMLPILSRQLKTLEEDVGVDVHSSSVIYPMLLANFLIIYPFVFQYFLTKLTNYHDSSHAGNSHFAKRALVLYAAEAAAVLPYAAFLLPEGYNYAAYSVFSSGLIFASAKSVMDFLKAVKADVSSAELGINAETLSFFEYIELKECLLKAAGSVPPAILMAFILYAVELDNSEIENSGSEQIFDVFLAWATAYVGPIVAATFIQGTHILLEHGGNLLLDDGSSSTPNNVVVSLGSVLSSVGRGICYTAFSQEFFEGIGVPPKVALGLAVVISGMFVNAASTLVIRKELMTILPRVKESSDSDWKDVVKAIFVATEGLLLSSPFIIEALSVLVEQDAIDPFVISTIIVLPYATCESAYAASVLHKALFGFETAGDQLNSEMREQGLLGDSVAGEGYGAIGEGASMYGDL